MKLADNNAVATDVDNNGSFTINANSKAFKILSDGLYSDKITAVIRELSCNAYDSHVAAGKADVPFEVHLPNVDEPWFSVQDHGLGLSDADITGIYTRYFSSTKTNSNDFVGQLGLGSKSPFSLVREFHVYSIYNGMVSDYRMYFDASDTPRVELLSQIPSTKPNGVKVVLYIVDPSDMHRFASKAADVFKWFSTTPIVSLANQPVSITNWASELRGSGWATMPAGNKNSLPVALMGNVAYPLTASSIKDATVDHCNLLNLPMVIRFDIGELEISASRESLGYDDRTCANITARLTQVFDEIKQHRSHRISSAETEWAARVTYDEMFGSTASYRWEWLELFRDHELSWNGIPIKSKSKTVDLDSIYDLSDNIAHVHRVIENDALLRRLDPKDFTQECSARDAVVFNDLDKKGSKRIRHWATTCQSKINITVYGAPSKVTWDDLKALLGNPVVVMASSLAEPPVKPKVVKAKMMIYMGHGWRQDKWKDADIDISQGGFWIRQNAKVAYTPAGTHIDINEMLDRAVKVKLLASKPTVYAGKGPMLNKLKDMPGWVNICDHVGNLLKKGIDTNASILDKIATSKAMSDMSNKVPNRIFNHQWHTLRDKQGAMARFIDMYHALDTSNNQVLMDKIANIIRIADSLKIKLGEGAPDPRIDELASEILHRYPLLQSLEWHAWRDKHKHITEYVDMVDMAWVYFELSRPVSTEEG